MTTYTVTASAKDNNGVRVTCSTAEVLGDAYGREYATREEAEVVAAQLQDEVADYDLDPSTEYGVVESEQD